MTKIQWIQTILGVEPDGIAGPITRQAFEDAIANTHRGIASVFADESDLAAFKKCKREGKSDNECFEVGDDGIGASGAVTSQSQYPMFALHESEIVEKWGSKKSGWGKLAKIAYSGKECMATLEDYMSSDLAQIDLNPAAVKELKIPNGGMVKVIWEWV